MSEDDLHLALMHTLERFDIPGEYADGLIDSLDSMDALDHLTDDEDLDDDDL